MENKTKFAQIGLIISLFAHSLVFLFLALHRRAPVASEESIEITLVDAANETLAKLPSPDDSLQVVEQSEKSLNDELSAKAKYLSRTNQTVAKETKVAKHGDFKNQGGRDSAAVTKQSTTAHQGRKQTFTVEGRRGDLTIAQLQPQFEWGEADEPRAPAADGASQSSDFLKEVDELSIQTLLNTREFVYYNYYSRIKDRLRQHWEPKIREKVLRMLRQGRKIASAEDDHITKVIITLNAQGILQKVQVIDPSGVRDLDDAAVEAFRAAAPFPNPPDGIIESDGTVKIHWDFVLEA